MSSNKPRLDIMFPALPVSIEQQPPAGPVIDYFFATSTD